MATDPLFGKAKWKDTETERDFQARVTDLFRLHGWRVYAIPDSRRATMAGYPDLTLWKGKRLLWVELKTEKGKLSPAQKVVLSELNEIAPAYVWRPTNWDRIVSVASGKEKNFSQENPT